MSEAVIGTAKSDFVVTVTEYHLFLQLRLKLDLMAPDHFHR